MPPAEVGAAVPKGSLRETFAETITEIAEERRDIVLLDGDSAKSSRTWVFSERHPERFFEMGIAEQNMVGVAAGLATVGFAPYVTSYACFQVYRAHDQVRVLVAQTGLPVRLVGGSAGLLFGSAGKTHQTPDDIAILRAMPGMTVVAPADATEARLVTEWSATCDRPVYIRLTRGTSPTIFGEDHRFDLGRGVELARGADVGIVSTGVQTTRVVEAVGAIRAAGFDPSVLHLPTVKPLDVDALEELAERTGRIVTVEEHSMMGGLGGAVCEALAERHPVPVRLIGLPDVYAESGPTLDLLDRYGLSGDRVAATVIGWLESSTRR